MCLAHLLDQYDSDIVIVSEHKLKPNSLMYMNSIDNRYTSVIPVRVDLESIPDK
jgi:hypothetical protein